MLGFYKTINAEHPELALKFIELGHDWSKDVLIQSILDSSDEQILRLIDERVYVPRLLTSSNAKRARHELTRPLDDAFRLSSTQKGLLENLTLAPLELKTTLAPDEVEVMIHAVGLNFRDVLNALGLYPGDPGPLGGDGAGVITRIGSAVRTLKPGDEVFGIIHGALSRMACVHQDNITIKPDTLSFAEASALPIVFLTVYYALTRCTTLKQGDTILIHAGAGGVGQAAIQIAKHLGARIITTAGGEAKRAFLEAQGIKHIFDSRSLSYGEDIKSLTHGQGVDVVLNSLSGEGFIETSVGICAQGAHFLEIGKRDIWSLEAMHSIRPDIDYHIIALDNISQSNPEVIQELLQELMPLFAAGVLSPLPITTFPIEQAIQAFDYMRAARHIGKVVIELPPAKTLRDIIRPDATYLISGGLGGLGQTVARWLSTQGATEIVLTGRKPLDEAIEALIQNLASESTSIRYASLDIGDEAQVKALLDDIAQTDKPLKGIFHLAGVLDDATLMEQDWAHFERVFHPKVSGSWNLHNLSKDLDLFLMFSSVASSLGNPGQSNYAAANGFMDALCAYRRAQGLPAHSLSWGPWAEVGMAKDLVSRHAKGGMIGIRPQEGMRLMEAALTSTQAHLTLVHMNWANYLKQRIDTPTWLSAFAQEQTHKESLVAQLELIAAPERPAKVKEYVVSVVRAVLGLSASHALDEDKGFFDMGLDSLMAIELKNQLQVGLGKAAILAATAVFDHSSVDKMARHIGELLHLEHLQHRPREVVLTPQMADEPIAIVGMSCRFPGGANDVTSYWSLLEEGRDGISDIPASRWDADAFYDANPDAPGKMSTKRGGFLDVDVSQFDAPFFRISPKEAEYLDPQQRLLLEVSYEAILSSGLNPADLKESAAGIFVGICSRDYMDLLTATGNKELINPYMATGNAASTATGRISFFFGFQGPNFAIDTPCSSGVNSGPSSKITCAFVPLKPKELTAARRMRSPRTQGVFCIGISAGKFISI
jgi:NADPH:quinone reductase-like Zn-dependent oxidoreductase